MDRQETFMTIKTWWNHSQTRATKINSEAAKPELHRYYRILSVTGDCVTKLNRKYSICKLQLLNFLKGER